MWLLGSIDCYREMIRTQRAATLPEAFPPGNEELSTEIDRIVYGN